MSERDLNGYAVPEGFDGHSARRHKRWRPGALMIAPTHLTCRCPCRIAHPRQMVDRCDSQAECVGQVVVATSFSGEQLLLPLCGPCTAVQMDERRRVAELERNGWRIGFGGLLQLAVLGSIPAAMVAAVLGNYGGVVWFLVGIGVAAGYMAWERRSYERRAG